MVTASSFNLYIFSVSTGSMRDIPISHERRGVKSRGADKYPSKNTEILRGEVTDSLSIELHGCYEVEELYAFFLFPKIDLLSTKASRQVVALRCGEGKK